jgi:hypothetical protein
MRRFIRIFFQEFFLGLELKDGVTRTGSMRNATPPEKEIHRPKADRDTRMPFSAEATHPTESTEHQKRTRLSRP